MWSKLLNIKLIIVVFLVLFSCKKEKYPEMKTGYYAVTETKTFSDGNVETESFTALGSYEIRPKESVYSFTCIKNNKAMSYNFNFNQNTSFDYFPSSYVNQKINYKITTFKMTSTELSVKRIEVNDSLTSNLYFKYIE